MKNSSILQMLLGSLFLALLFGAILPGPAFAEDGAPPADPIPTAEPVISTEVTVEEPDGEISAEAAAPVAKLPGNENSLEVGMAVTEATEDQEDSTSGDAVDLGADAVSLLAELSPDTSLIIISEGGEPLPLASEEAAELVEIIDPRWCPVGVQPGGMGCTGPYQSIWLLIDAIAEGYIPEPTANGVIWIQSGADQSDLDVVIDGSASHFTNWAKYTLTLNGGWSGGNNTSVNIANPSVFDQSISILNWANNVALSDITFDGGGLEISTTGKVNLTRVQMKNGGGADIDNDGGVQDVVITSSEFSDNSGSGLTVSSKGAITLNNISGINNTGDGARLDNAGGVKGVTLNGTNIFAENEGSGLVVRSKGAITINNLVANANGGYGADLENDTAATAQPVYLNYRNEFKYNEQTGLLVESVGTVTLTNLTATHNGGGALIDNAGPFYANITLQGVNQFSYNDKNGLEVTSSGNIVLSNVTAIKNGLGGTSGSGATLDNADVGIPKSVLLTGINTFNFNLDSGLVIDSFGAISISNLTTSGNENGFGAALSNRIASSNQQNITLTGLANANDNGTFGIHILSYGNVSLIKAAASRNGDTGLFVKNDRGKYPKNVSITGGITLTGNGDNGLELESSGAVTIDSLQANSNDGTGASLDNSSGQGTITIRGINGFSGNLGGGGLYASSKGSITLYNLEASRNSGDGVYLNNAYPGVAGSVNLITSISNWCNETDANSGSGIKILSNGSVALSNLCADGNGSLTTPGYGAAIDNRSALGFKPVTLTGTNSFTENYTGGIQILSSGVITVYNVTASRSLKGFGADFKNTYSGVISPQSINIKGTNHFSANFGTGLSILSYGAIYGSNLTASSNGANGGSGYGAWLDNCNQSAGACTIVRPQSITLTGYNSFSSNKAYGLQVTSLGTINLASVHATYNTATGAILDNDFPGAVGGVSVTGTLNEFSFNANGLEMNSRRAISISNLDASFNTGYGALLSNFANSPYPQNITLTGRATFDGNENGYGLSVMTLGAITINNLSATNNGAQGAILDNALSTAAISPISLNGAQLLYNNGDSGLEITSNRAVTISNVTASLNNGYGASINNRGAGLLYDVKLLGSNSFNENDWIGLDIHTLGAITLNNITANGNGVDEAGNLGAGVHLDNKTGAPLAKSITLTGTNTFNENFEDGLSILSLGTIKAYSLTASGNGGNGAYLDNQSGANTAGITLAGTNNFIGNKGIGIVTLSRGVISMTNLVANLNTQGGAKVDNSGSDIAAAVNIGGVNSFSDNGTLVVEGTGLLVKSRGKITLSNIAADGNSSFGVKLDNKTSAIGAPGITLTGVSSFSANTNTGVFIEAGGDVNLSKFVADGNTGDGVFIASLKNVTLTCGSLTSNQGTGLAISALSGTLTLKGVFVYGNEYENSHLNAGSFVQVRGCP